jgi:hypothetical protein
MPSYRLFATITSGCQQGAGVLTLTDVTSGAPPDANLTYEWSLLTGSGQQYGNSFDATELPYALTGLPNGSYTSQVTGRDPNTGNAYLSATRVFEIACGPGLQLDYATATDATATGNGTVSVGAHGGTSPLTAVLVELNISQQLMPDANGQLQTVFGNIPAGTYTVRVTDSSTPAQQVQATVTVGAYAKPPVRGCTDPAADNYDPLATQDDDSCVYTPPVRVPWFEVQPNRADKPAFDNTLLADEAPLDYTNPGYCQLVEQGDTLVLQVQSNYQGAPTLQLRRCADDVVVKTTVATRVLQGAGQTAAFEVYLKADPIASFTRVYFNNDALPLPFLPGQRVTISSTGTALDGTYPLHDVLEDAAAAVPYLRLLTPYPSGMLRLDGALTTTYAVQVYDTYQVVVPFAGLPMGCYYARITATDGDFSPALAVSESIDLAPQHAGSKLITYRNFDNAFNLNYSNGLVNRLRVTGRFFDRKPATEKTVLRNDDSELVLLAASVYRKVQLETLLLPGWLHEVLAVAFAHDFVKVDDVRVVLEADYSYEPVERYTLGKGEALLEVANFLGAGNRDDLEDVDGTGTFLTVNSNFLKVNL